MKTLKSLLVASATVLALSSLARGTVLLSDSFDYSNGALVGQGSWLQTGTTATTPIQVVGGSSIVLATGQDVYKALSSTQTLSTVGSLYFSLDFKVSTATATGDYFYHVTPDVGNSSSFYGRLFAKSSGAGYVLGFLDVSGGTTTFSSTVLTLAQDYKIVIGWTSVAGADNDSFKLYIDPVSGIESSNTTYLSHTWTSATDEPLTVAAINFRQAAGNAAGVTVYNTVVATTFAEAAGIAAVPEPGTYAAILGGLALAGVVASRRRRASSAA